MKQRNLVRKAPAGDVSMLIKYFCDLCVCVCLSLASPSMFLSAGSGVSLQVHRPVSDPLLSGHLWDGGGAVPHQHPGAVPVHPLRPQPGQPQLRDAHLHTGEGTHAHTHTWQGWRGLLAPPHTCVFGQMRLCSRSACDVMMLPLVHFWFLLSLFPPSYHCSNLTLPSFIYPSLLDLSSASFPHLLFKSPTILCSILWVPVTPPRPHPYTTGLPALSRPKSSPRSWRWAKCFLSTSPCPGPSPGPCPRTGSWQRAGQLHSGLELQRSAAISTVSK